MSVDNRANVRKLIAIYKPKARAGLSPKVMHTELNDIDDPRPLTPHEIAEVVYECYRHANIHAQ